MLENLRNIFSAPETKASRTTQLIQLQSTGRALWTPRDYATLAHEGYVANAIVHRAVKLVAESAASVSFIAYEGAQARRIRSSICSSGPSAQGAGGVPRSGLRASAARARA